MYQSQYKKRSKNMPRMNVPIIQRQTLCTVEGGVITAFTLDRNSVRSNYVEGLSHNHSTAFNVFSGTIQRRLIGKTLSEAFCELSDIAAETALLPGAERHLGEIFTLMELADNRAAQNPPITKQDVIDYAEKLLGIRNSLDFTYLPGRDEAVGHGEKGKMVNAYKCLLAGNANGAALNMGALFDTTSDGFTAITNYDLLMYYLPQHIGSLYIAFRFLPDVNPNILSQALAIVEEIIKKEWIKLHPGSIGSYLNRPVPGY